MGLIPLFSIGAIFASIDKFREEREDGIKMMLASVGEEIVDEAKENPGYTHHTHNLQSSIGYTIVLDNEIKLSHFQGKTEGVQTGKEAVDEWIAEHPMLGWRLIVTAGMQYAAKVESLGKEVLSNAVLTKQELLRHFRKEMGLAA